MTPQEALAFDSKIDDGIHYTGDVQAIDGFRDVMTHSPGLNCTSSSTSGTYMLDLEDRGCNIGIRSEALN